MTKSIWDDFAKSYDQVLKNWSLYQTLRDGAIYHLKNAKLVLEQGCGTGIIAIALAESGKEVFGIDNNASMLKVARKNTQEDIADRLHIQEGDALNLDFEDKSFDGVISNNVIFYIKNPIRLVQEAYRVLKPGGRFIIAGPKPDYVNKPYRMNDLVEHIISEFKNKRIYDSLKNDLDSFLDCSVRLQNDGVYNTYEIDEMISLLKSVGFSKEIASTEDIYLGLCYQVTVEK